MRRALTVAVVGLALLVAVPAVAQPPKPLVGDLQIGFMDELKLPDVKCAGGEPTGLPFPQCSDRTQRINGRNELQLWYPRLDTLAPELKPYVQGPITFVVNCTFNANYRGPCWGTFKWEADNGVWEGSWVAPVMDLNTYESVLMMTGHGTSGLVDGRQIKFDGASAAGDWYISGKVRVH